LIFAAIFGAKSASASLDVHLWYAFGARSRFLHPNLFAKVPPSLICGCHKEKARESKLLSRAFRLCVVDAGDS
jgi:hypothetical protein